MKRILFVPCILCLVLLLSCKESIPEQKLIKLTVAPGEFTLEKGKTTQLVVSWLPTEVKGNPLFKSSNEEVVQVDEGGLVRAVSIGEATVVVKLFEKSAKAKIKVVKEGETSTVTKVTLMPDKLHLKIGEKQKIAVRWEPETIKATPQFSSSNTSIVTVDSQGEVKALSLGEAEVMVVVNNAVASCKVSVTEQIQNQMPLLLFSKEKSAKKSILDYEEQLGRKYTKGVLVQGNFAANAFVDKSLDIFPVVCYGLEDQELNPVITVLGKEPIQDCNKTLSLLKKNGFSNASTKTNSQGQIRLSASYDKNPKLVVLGQEQIIQESDLQPETYMILMFINKAGYPLAPREHDCISNVKDFPSWNVFLTKDTQTIKAFEESSGFRYFKEEFSTADNLTFMTKDSKRAETNLSWVYYVTKPDEWVAFIDCGVSCIDKADQINTESVRAWLALNGFSNNFKRAFSKDDWYYVWNEDKSVGVQICIERARAICSMQIVPGNTLSSYTKANHIRNLAKQYRLERELENITLRQR